MDRRDIKPFEQMRSEITRMMARDERGSMARNAMVAKLKMIMVFFGRIAAGDVDEVGWRFR